MEQLTSVISKDGSRQLWIMRSVLDELIEEMAEYDEEVLSEWFAKCGMMLEWVGTGEVPDGLADDFLKALPSAERIDA